MADNLKDNFISSLLNLLRYTLIFSTFIVSLLKLPIIIFVIRLAISVSRKLKGQNDNGQERRKLGMYF